ncbi:hypothetical protein [Segatella copri]|jgi:hypothetical protein|uniref:Uncharacterized protein n=1 Tax=Segatella copri TaxID=165179 RepID=A0AA92TFL8_9BACT|nr:hypothetical protein [Segatella copri]RGN03229.1 hypothetical protein DXB80_14235 [Segatella copri]RGQ08620.1 hypothetical protein DWZ10_09900 [Segatella copri]
MENYNIFLSYFHQEIQTPEIVDFSSLQNIAGENLSIDVSANNSSEDYIWGIQNASSNISDEQKLKTMSEYEDFFISHLIDTDFDESIEPEILVFARRQIAVNKVIFLTWLEQLFWNYQKNELFVVKLIDLFLCFDYEEVQPQASMLAVAFKVIKSHVIQSKNLSLLGHWCNKKALSIIEDFEEPTDPWLQIKYNHLKNVIRKRCTILEK